jgi:hypothetical protein
MASSPSRQSCSTPSAASSSSCLLIGLMALNYVAGLAIGWVKAPPPLGCSSGQGRQGDLGTLSLIAPVGSAPASRSRAA